MLKNSWCDLGFCFSSSLSGGKVLQLLGVILSSPLHSLILYIFHSHVKATTSFCILFVMEILLSAFSHNNEIFMNIDFFLDCKIFCKHLELLAITLTLQLIVSLAWLMWCFLICVFFFPCLIYSSL